MFLYSILFTIFVLLDVSLQATRDVPGRTALDDYPLIDGHNDLAYNLYIKLRNQIDDFPLDTDLSHHPVFGFDACDTCNTDLVRIKKGKLGAQFWSAYVECGPDKGDAVSKTLEQIDVIKRFVQKYPRDLELVTRADGIVDAFLHKKLASLIGVEGGHSIDNKMALLRQFYDLGARYMTLTHTCNLPWADASPNDSPYSTVPKVNLTEFGKKIVLEMNRLGMIVDLSHVSHGVMSAALDVSKAPVIFSHSASYTMFPHHRNVRDDILTKLKSNGGIIMVTFCSGFIGGDYVTLKHVARHINYIVSITGIDHVGIGSDFDGYDSFPVGLEDVSKFPDLFDFLKEDNATRWTIENLQKLAGKNFYRVFKKVEEVKEHLLSEKPDESLIPEGDLGRTSDSSLKPFSNFLIIGLLTIELLMNIL